MGRFEHAQVGFCLLFIALLTLANLRGLKESGTIFAFPTYFFVFMAGLMIILGTIGPMFGWQIHGETANQEIPPEAMDKATGRTRDPPGFLLLYGVPTARQP